MLLNSIRLVLFLHYRRQFIIKMQHAITQRVVNRSLQFYGLRMLFGAGLSFFCEYYHKQLFLNSMKSQKQTDSRLSSRDRTKSNKKLVQIRIHIKTEKANKLVHNQKNRTSFSRDQPSSKDAETKKNDKAGKPFRQHSASSIWSGKNALKWNIAKPHDQYFISSQLPEITQYRGANQWVSKAPSKKSIPNKSTKIQFKELVPIKQISKEDRIQNLRKIRDQFRELVNTSNNILVKNSESVFRAYVQKGNNGVLVKQLIKKRWWWHMQQNPGKANLFWTEWYNGKFTSQMLQIKNETNYEQDYNSKKSNETEPKIQSIRMIVDQSTFSRIKPRISIREEHYLKSHNRSVQIRQNGPEEIQIKEVSTANNVMHNHIDGCLQLHSKKLLFKNLHSYLTKKSLDPFEFIPITYYLQSKQKSSIDQVLRHYDSIEENKATNNAKNLWIVKPGENSNRGFGITVHSDRTELENELLKRLQDTRRSVIVQKYMENCFLVEGRKFDLRCYILITTVNGCLKGYWYNDGYIRTSSQQFSLDDCSNLMVHLTNDAVQKHNESYGKYEDFNKMSFSNFKKYIAKMGIDSTKFDEAYNKMKSIAYYLIASTSNKIKRKQYTFQLFGLDFMFDNQLTPFLIEANSNPCLQTSGVILGKLIPELIDNVIMTAIDPLFPPPNKGKTKEYLSKDYFRSNKFQLIFNEGLVDSKRNYVSTQA